MGSLRRAVGYATDALQAIALAGGVDDKTADLGGIVLMRQVDGKRMAAAYDLRQTEAPR